MPLREFSVGNFRSFRDEAVLRLVGPEGVQPVAAVFGANAAGKSNFLHALAALQLHLVRPGSRANLFDFPFAFGSAEPEPARWAVTFEHSGARFFYSLSIKGGLVVHEELARVHGRARKPFFVRHGQDYDTAEPFTAVLKLVRPDAPLLKVAADYNVRVAMSAIEWFATRLMPVLDVDAVPFQETTRIAGHYIATANERKALVSILRGADMQITDVRVDRGRLETRHDGGGAPKWFDLEHQESAGTRRFFRILLYALPALATGGTLVVDEIDARLHPKLTEALIRMFLDPAVNRSEAQLVFTTHDTRLLDAMLLTKDQVWFVEKRADEASELVSLAEFKGVRRTGRWQSAYLAGQFGGTPIIDDSRFRVPVT